MSYALSTTVDQPCPLPCLTETGDPVLVRPLLVDHVIHLVFDAVPVSSRAGTDRQTGWTRRPETEPNGSRR